MKSTALQKFLTVIILFGGGVILYFVLAYAIRVFSALDNQVAASIIAAVGTILAALVATLYAQRRSAIREIAESHRPKKVEIYSRFMDVLIENQKNSNKGLEQDDLTEKFVDFFYEFTKDTLVWASPSFLRAYRAFKDAGGKGGVNLLLLMDDMLREIRADLNISNKGIQRGDLIKMFLKDSSELDRALAGEHPMPMIPESSN